MSGENPVESEWIGRFRRPQWPGSDKRTPSSEAPTLTENFEPPGPVPSAGSPTACGLLLPSLYFIEKGVLSGYYLRLVTPLAPSLFPKTTLPIHSCIWSRTLISVNRNSWTEMCMSVGVRRKCLCLGNYWPQREKAVVFGNILSTPLVRSNHLPRKRVWLLDELNQ